MMLMMFYDGYLMSVFSVHQSQSCLDGRRQMSPAQEAVAANIMKAAVYHRLMSCPWSGERVNAKIKALYRGREGQLVIIEHIDLGYHVPADCIDTAKKEDG